MCTQNTPAKTFLTLALLVSPLLAHCAPDFGQNEEIYTVFASPVENTTDVSEACNRCENKTETPVCYKDRCIACHSVAESECKTLSECSWNGKKCVNSNGGGDDDGGGGVVGNGGKKCISGNGNSMSLDSFIKDKTSRTVRGLTFLGATKLCRGKNFTITLTNVNADYLVYVESHGHKGHDNVNKTSKKIGMVSNAVNLGTGGGRDKYLSLHDLKGNTVTISDESVGAVYVYFVKTQKEVKYIGAWSVDSSIDKERDPDSRSVPGAINNDEVCLYADDQGGKSSRRDATYQNNAAIQYGTGDDRLYVYDKNLPKKNGNGAYMLIRVK